MSRHFNCFTLTIHRRIKADEAVFAAKVEGVYGLFADFLIKADKEGILMETGTDFLYFVFLELREKFNAAVQGKTFNEHHFAKELFFLPARFKGIFFEELFQLFDVRAFIIFPGFVV